MSFHSLLSFPELQALKAPLKALSKSSASGQENRCSPFASAKVPNISILPNLFYPISKIIF